jgi:hypothetical protein
MKISAVVCLTASLLMHKGKGDYRVIMVTILLKQNVHCGAS